MRFKLDENLPAELADVLREAGHNAQTVEEEGLVGCSDARLLERAAAERSAFLTLDKGVADLRAYPPSRYEGIILLRPGSAGKKAVLAFLKRNLPFLLRENLVSKLVVVSNAGIRARR